MLRFCLTLSRCDGGRHDARNGRAARARHRPPLTAPAGKAGIRAGSIRALGGRSERARVGASSRRPPGPWSAGLLQTRRTAEPPARQSTRPELCLAAKLLVVAGAHVGCGLEGDERVEGLGQRGSCELGAPLSPRRAHPSTSTKSSDGAVPAQTKGRRSASSPFEWCSARRRAGSPCGLEGAARFVDEDAGLSCHAARERRDRTVPSACQRTMRQRIALQRDAQEEASVLWQEAPARFEIAAERQAALYAAERTA